MEFYLSLGELAGKMSNPVSAVFLPIFLILTALEAMVIIWRSGTYPWKNAGVSLCMALGHLITQAAAHGLILSIIAAAIYKIRLTTIPVSFNNWTNLIILFLLVDLASMWNIAARIGSSCYGHRIACITAVIRCRPPPHSDYRGPQSYPACLPSICRSCGSATIPSGSMAW